MLTCSFIYFVCDIEVDELPAPVQDQLFAELLDKDAQEQLESDPAVINWSLDITVRLGSRLYALWNRSAGDCLLDSVMQATWGVFDRDNMLRRALAESLGQGGHMWAIFFLLLRKQVEEIIKYNKKIFHLVGSKEVI